MYFLHTNFKDFTWLFWTEVLGKVQNLNTNVLSNWSACQSFVWPQSHCHHHGLHRVTEIELPHHVDHLCHKSLKPALLPNCTCISHTIFEFVKLIVYSLSMVYCRRKISSWWTSLLPKTIQQSDVLHYCTLHRAQSIKGWIWLSNG